MGFISNKEREKTSRKLYGGYGAKKFIILITLIIGVLCAIYIFLGIAAQMEWINVPYMQFVTSGGTPEPDTVGLPLEPGAPELTTYGIIAIVFVCIEIAFGLISFILLLTMKSPKNVTKDVIKLTSSAIPGRRTSKNVSKTAKERI